MMFALESARLWLFDLSVKATLLLVIAVSLNILLRRSSAAARHRLWALTMLSLLVLPVLPLMTPTMWSVRVPQQVAPFLPPAISVMNVASDSDRSSAQSNDRVQAAKAEPTITKLPSEKSYITDSRSSPLPSKATNHRESDAVGTSYPRYTGTVLPLIWLCGTMACVVHLAVGTWRVMCFRHAASPVADSSITAMVDDLRSRLVLKRSVEVREHPEPVVPVAVGVFRPLVVLPIQARAWSESLRRMVLLHELAHVRRCDVAIQWLGRLSCAVYWFHPLAWWAQKQLRRERELACDDLVVHCGERASDYAEVLVSIAKSFHAQRGLACAVAMAQHGSLEGRMRSLFDRDVVRSHAPLGRRVAWAMFVVSAFAAVALSGLRLAAQPISKPQFAGLQQPGDEVNVAEDDTKTDSGFSLPGAIGDAIDEMVGNTLGGFPEGLDDYRNSGPLRVDVKIVDESGQPVAGAKLLPWGFGTSNGTGWGWFELWPKEFVTDADGKAQILVSAEQTAFVPAESGDFTYVSFLVEHPDFAKFIESRGSLQSDINVVLKRGMKVSARAIDAETKLPVSSEIFGHSSGYSSLKWEVVEDRLQSVAFDPKNADTGRYFRIISAPANQPENQMKFSEVLDASEVNTGTKEGFVELDVPLYPGVPLTGSLSDNVERPVKSGGHVIATIVSDADHQRCVWQDMAKISEDGTFSFPALPRHSHVELIAVCDGWVSKCPQEVLADYDQQHRTSFKKLGSSDMVSSTPLFLDEAAATMTIGMVATSFCKFEVKDEKGEPIDLAMVLCMPNQCTRMGSTMLGSGGRSIDSLRSVKPSFATTDFGRQYMRATNDRGIAVIPNLPAGSQNVSVHFPGYRVGAFGLVSVEIEEGELAQSKLRMTRTETFDSSQLGVLPADADGFQSVMLTVVDEDGALLSTATVTPRGLKIGDDAVVKPWPTDWPGETKLQQSGFSYVIRMRRPDDVSPEDFRNVNILVDIEAPGFQSITNHEISLQRLLPVRLLK